MDRLRIFSLLWAQCGFEDQICHADHAVHRCADFMADVGDKFGLDARGFKGSIMGGFEPELYLLAFCDVTHDGLHHALTVQGHGIQGNFCGEARAISPHAYPFKKTETLIARARHAIAGKLTGAAPIGL